MDDKEIIYNDGKYLIKFEGNWKVITQHKGGLEMECYFCQIYRSEMSFAEFEFVYGTYHEYTGNDPFYGNVWKAYHNGLCTHIMDEKFMMLCLSGKPARQQKQYLQRKQYLDMIYINNFRRGIGIVNHVFKKRLHYLIYNLWHYYWYDQRDKNGHSRACKYICRQLVT